MSDTVIQVENLARCFQLRPGSRRERYLSLRDQIVQSVRGLGSSLMGKKRAKTTQDFWALKDVNFNVERGQTVAVIGRNGAGKSTLLKILSRVVEPTSGRIRIRGRLSSLLEVGTGFHPELTGRENIFLNGAILGMRHVDIIKKFDEIVAFAEVEKFLETPVKRYSSGMYMRLAFAVAAHLDPDILVVDEVLAVGDAAFQKKCLGKMQDVATQQGRTVLFVSHNLGAVQSLCQRAIWLHDGKVCRDGPVGPVVNEYLSSHVEGIAEKKWANPLEAPGDDRVRLLAARIRQAGRVTSLYDINQPAEFEVEFETLRDCRNIVSGVSFYDVSGVCLTAHCDWRPNSVPKGRYVKRMHVPARTFAEGSVNVLFQLVFYDPNVLSVILPNLLSFEAVESGTADAVRGLYSGPWPGMVRLGFEWGDAERLVQG
jgi:lipopolysaccharide transport system ATP-binding protein